jgi:hypothetical protein
MRDLQKLHDWEKAVVLVYNAHKKALGYEVCGISKLVVDDKLVQNTESA